MSELRYSARHEFCPSCGASPNVYWCRDGECGAPMNLRGQECPYWNDRKHLFVPAALDGSAKRCPCGMVVERTTYAK